MKQPHSIYHLLGDLSQQIEVCAKQSTDSTQIPPDKPSAPTVTSSTDYFQEAMMDVKKINQNKGRIPVKSIKKQKPPYVGIHDFSMREVLNENYPITVRNLPEYMEGSVVGLNPEIMERLRNEEYSIQKVLDLHGLSSIDAASMFASFMNDAVHRGIKCVKVIHGRGLKSKSGPVLKEKLKEWLIRAINRKWVIAFCSSKMSHGGPGATIILLRDKPRKERITIIG
jgi:DNA-nicking Smr family endonuclease